MTRSAGGSFRMYRHRRSRRARLTISTLRARQPLAHLHSVLAVRHLHSAHRREGEGTMHGVVTKRIATWICPLWGQVDRRLTESSLAGSAGCGHITIATTVCPLFLSFSPFLYPSAILALCLSFEFLLSLHRRAFHSFVLHGSVSSRSRRPNPP